MSYTDYKQQYTFGFGPIDIAKTFSSSSTVFFAGDAYGLKNYLSTENADAKTLPLDLKAEKQMFSKKALLKIKCLEGFLPCGVKQVVKITFSGTAGAAGSVTLQPYGEDEITVTIANGNTATQSGDAVATACAGLKHWDVANASGVVSFTAKAPAANITVNATNFPLTADLTTQSISSSAFVSVTSGVAPEEDTKYLKIDLCSSETAPSETSANTASGVVPDVTLYVHPQTIANQDLFEITMPSTLKRYCWLEVSMPNASSTTMTAGKLLVHFIPNLV